MAILVVNHDPETRIFLLKSAGILDLGVVQLPGWQTRLSRNDGKNTSPFGLEDLSKY
jgi:hypothetical protein